MRPSAVLLLALALALALAPAWAGPGGAKCGWTRICKDPGACSIMLEEPPPEFDIQFKTNVGTFTVHVVTAHAPPYARRAWRLSRLGYWSAARFFRVAFVDTTGKVPPSPPFVVQFGYSGDAKADACWDSDMTSNETSAVAPPGNLRGYVAFAMDAVPNGPGAPPHCAPDAPYCALGFSTNIFVNMANNSRLDGPGFAPFGKISDADMVNVVDKIYSGYGDVRQLCDKGSTDVYCVGYGDANKGVNMTRLTDVKLGGNKYLRKDFKKLSYCKSVKVTAAPPPGH